MLDVFDLAMPLYCDKTSFNRACVSTADGIIV